MSKGALNLRCRFFPFLYKAVELTYSTWRNQWGSVDVFGCLCCSTDVPRQTASSSLHVPETWLFVAELSSVAYEPWAAAAER